MRMIRLVMTILVAIGLSLSPVAAGMVRIHLVKCDLEQMATDTQTMTSDQDNCSCCKGTAKCPPAFCGTTCAGAQAIVGTDIDLPEQLRQKLSGEPFAFLLWRTWPPDPPPPRI